MHIRIITAVVLGMIAGCGYQPDELDHSLHEQIDKHELKQPFQPDLVASVDKKAMADLGGDLFFSPDLSVNGEVACVSCHHPDKAGADGVALPIGIGGVDSIHVGEDRIAAAEKQYKGETIKGLIPRNSPTVFNAALYQKNLFWDGRAQYVRSESGETLIKVGFGLTPYSPDSYQKNSLLQAQARMPLTSAFEMKGALHSNKNNHEIEQGVVEFLRSNPYWCKRFSAVFELADCKKAITLDGLTQVLAEYQATLVFTDSRFESYVQGNYETLNQQQKQGALLFFKGLDEGGLGCVACHSGKILSDESFYNLGLPASGIGANEKGWDFGRRNVDREVKKFMFKTPSLLNIAETGPYFHNGIAPTLKEAILFHVPQALSAKAQHRIAMPGVNYTSVDSLIEVEFSSYHKETKALLPKSISEVQVQQLVAFLQSLSDSCITDKACTAKLHREVIRTDRPAADKHEARVRGRSSSTMLKPAVMPDLQCNKSDIKGKGRLFFSAHDADIGLGHQRKVGLVKVGWLLDIVNHAGVSAQDVNYDCLDDLIFDAGENGLVFYVQRPDGSFVQQRIYQPEVQGMISPLLADVDGDYQFDVLVGNDGRDKAFALFNVLGSAKDLGYFDQLNGPVINASFADIDADGQLDIGFAFWRSYKSLQQEHLWLGDDKGWFSPRDKALKLRVSGQHASDVYGDYITQKSETPFGHGDVSFTPNFADIDLDGDQDLLLAADFVRSQVLINEGGEFVDRTAKKVIDESNGMGVAIADFERNGLLDWYVTSINHKKEVAGGNNLYRNKGGAIFEKDDSATVYEDAWSWGACAKDFNNDGYEDIFYISGYGEPLHTATYETDAQSKSSKQYLDGQHLYKASQPRLLINDGKGGFINRSDELGFSGAFNGRGIACFDYQQDGDIDIVVAGIEGKPRLYQNHLNGTKNWVAVRLLGMPGNTEAFGAKVYLTTSKGQQYREVRFENNYVSRNPGQLHFGLGDESVVESLEVHFPDGRQVILKQPAINQLHVISNGKAPTL